jgi:CHASE3 domain sensor protein
MIFMQIPIFWRLILGTLGILLLSIAACLYSIIQLGTLSRTARAALDGDHRMIGYQEALTDAFLSEVRYGGKYIIMHTEDRHEQLRQFKNDFARYLEELKSLTQSEEVANRLSRVEQLHRQYHELFDREAAYIRAKQAYAQSRYQQERDKVFESALSELERLKALLQKQLQDKLESIDRAAKTAQTVAIITTLIVALLGTLFSLKISKSIAAPLPQHKGSTESEFLESSDTRSSASQLREIQELPSAIDQKGRQFDAPSLKPLLRRLNTLATLSSLTRRLKMLRRGKAIEQ